MILDAMFAFDKTPRDLTVGAADLVSTNVHDAGSAKKLFGGNSSKHPYLVLGYKCTAGTGTLSFRARFVGADNAALTTNPEIIADTGVTLRNQADAVLAIGDTLYWAIPLQGQRNPKQFYGVISTQGTADQDGTLTAVITEAPQTNMPAFKAAVP